MKPLNIKELKNAYRVFILYFLLLSTVSLFSVGLFFAAQNAYNNLIRDKAEHIDRTMRKRLELNGHLGSILKRFNELSRFTPINAQEINNQSIMMEDIARANFRIKAIIMDEQPLSESFVLYRKISDDITAMTNVQDSLSRSRFQLESIRAQLKSCLNANQSKSNRVNRGIFR